MNTNVDQPQSVEHHDTAPVAPVLHHVNLKTRRLGEMIAWYGLVLGMTVTFEFPGGAWLSNDEANHRLALLSPHGLVDPEDRRAQTGLHHTAFEYRSLDELLGAYERLREHGLEPRRVLDHGMTLSFYYDDPDGNGVELQFDWFGDWAQSSEWMRTSADFAADPIGPACDPAKILDAYSAGATLQDLHRRAYAGEFRPAEPPDPGRPRFAYEGAGPA